MDSAHFKATTTTRRDDAPKLGFQPFLSTAEWLKAQPIDEWRQEWQAKGVIQVDNLVDPENLKIYAEQYDKLLDGRIDASSFRHDLGNNEDRHLDHEENVCQIMWPYDQFANMDDGPLHQRTEAVARILLGDDTAFDFDMLIYKAPGSATDVPWHQDEGYWPDMPDKRAVSCWVAIDEAVVDNGCMWFHPSGPVNLFKHSPACPGKHVLAIADPAFDPREGKPKPLRPGSCTFHHGRTPHYTRGNTTETRRRAYITNYRPKAMVEWERTHGFSHLREGWAKNDDSVLPSYKG